MKRWIIIDLILLALLAAAVVFMKRSVDHHYQSLPKICPEWLQDSPQKGCEGAYN